MHPGQAEEGHDDVQAADHHHVPVVGGTYSSELYNLWNLVLFIKERFVSGHNPCQAILTSRICYIKVREVA